MAFITPLALAFAGLSIPIILLYMLKLRRRDVLVSSTLLWQRLLRDREANAPWQRLRRNLLLLLQLLILALLTLSLARPFVSAPSVASGSVVILLDASASMQARDVMDISSAPTRFDAACDAAHEVIAGIGSGDVATLVAVGPQPRVLASATGNKTLLHRTLEDVSPSNGAADWESAFALTSAGLVGAADTQVVIISDGALPDSLPSLPGRVRFVGVGGAGDNVAIAALATRAGPTGPQVFIRVVNYGEVDAEPLVEFSADGALFDARRLSVPKRSDAHNGASLTLTDLPYDMHVLQAQLSTEDSLPLDDVAWDVHVPPASGRVLLLSEGNLFLERALGALPDVELTRAAPDQPPSADEDYALYVYDAVTPTLPSGNLWLIGPQASLGDESSIKVGGFFTNTAISQIAADAPLLRYVDLSDLHILRARVVEPPPAARVLVEAEGGPLLFVAERPEGRLAVLTFDLRDSDLPLQIAFPILTANLVDWLLPQGAATFPLGEGRRSSLRPGDPVPLQPDPEAVEIIVTAPDSTRSSFPVAEKLPVFAATDQPGIYLVEQFDRSEKSLQSAAFAVNLFDETESDITPRESVRVGQTEVSSATREEEGRREFWPWLAGAALSVLVVEWWSYQRGTRR